MIDIKKIRVRLPSGKNVIRIKRKKPNAAVCAVCKKPLHGVPRGLPVGMRKLAKTEKRPERAYGGYLCSACSRELFMEKIRGKFKEE